MKYPMLFLLIALAAASCTQAPTAPTTNVIMPLKVGNQWIGRVTTDSAGSAIVRYDTLTIVEEVVIGKETWYKSNHGDLYINRADGLWWTDDDFVACGNPMVKYPAGRGDTALLPTVKVLLPGSLEPVDQIVGTEVMATDTNVSVPVGAYSCYHYAFKLYAPVNAKLIGPVERFYAPNVGPVLLISGDMRWELVAVRLN